MAELIIRTLRLGTLGLNHANLRLIVQALRTLKRHACILPMLQQVDRHTHVHAGNSM